jgi:Peptidase family M48
MVIEPEVAFHRYFQRPERHPDNRRDYRGKQNLDASALGPTLGSFLRDIQNALNEALRNEKQNVTEHVKHPPFHFDYIDATVPNALAFISGDYSFIGITMPLIYMLWDSCVELSKSKAVGALLGIPVTPESEEAILTVMFQTQITFVVTHEYTHHVHGHLSQSAPGSAFYNEMLSSGDAGSLEEQAFEMDADAYAVYQVLAHLITGPRREQATELLGCVQAHANMQDEALFSSFVVAVGAFLLLLPPASVDPSTIYNRTHPPQAVRMNGIMHSAISWCEQNRPALVPLMTLERFQTIMTIVYKTVSGMNGDSDWNGQTAFLKSDDGSEYSKKLRAQLRNHIQSL